MDGIYTLLVSALKLAVQNGKKRVAQEIQSTLIKNYKGNDVKLEVRAIMKNEKTLHAASPVTNTSGQKMTAASLSLADFEKKTVTPSLKAAVAKDGVKTFNPHKALLEMTDEEIIEKMGKSTDSSTIFINQIREITGEEKLEDPKDFTVDFMKSFRATLQKRNLMTEDEVKEQKAIIFKATSEENEAAEKAAAAAAKKEAAEKAAAAAAKKVVKK